MKLLSYGEIETTRKFDSTYQIFDRPFVLDLITTTDGDIVQNVFHWWKCEALFLGHVQEMRCNQFLQLLHIGASTGVPIRTSSKVF